MHDNVNDVPDEFLRNVADRLREPVVASPGFDDWIMAEVRAAAGPRREAKRARPWYARRAEWVAVGALLAVVAVTVGVLRVAPSTMPPRVAQTHVVQTTPVLEQTPMVAFTFSAPRAQSVTVAGTFNGWDTRATPLHRTADGQWRVSVPLGAGRYTYMFVVDGQRWMLDPSAARDAATDFGSANSVVMVVGRRET